MTFIHLTTVIHAPIERCFDLARSIDVHQRSTASTREKAIAGRTTGLIGQGETVTWEAYHLFMQRQLTVIITDMSRPHFFRDEMLAGTFASMHHEHLFREENSSTVMEDRFFYETPFGIAGTLFDRLILKTYMTKFLVERNRVLKEYAESDEWKKYLL